MDSKETLDKAEGFAKKIANLAKEEGLTIYELCKAADVAQEEAFKFVVDNSGMETWQLLVLISFIVFLADYKPQE
ncbi:MAG: hypothetical protein K2G89_03430 [Lachnospiraceae bacterium]|nr:hypothetical protein [Lachnospiraceae bacterium]